MSTGAAAPVAFTDAKRKSLDNAIAQIEKSFGKGSLMRLGDEGAVKEIEAISTGSLGLDVALGIGGLPTGRIVEIYGPESSGKTTLALHVIAEAQKKGGGSGFVDDEHAVDPAKADKLGVYLGEVVISQTDNGDAEQEVAAQLRAPGA